MTPVARHTDTDRRGERILVVCTQYIGDTLLAIPFLRNLRRTHPAAVIDVCAQGAARAVLGSCPYVDELVPWQRPGRESRGSISGAVAGVAAQAAWLRSRGYAKAYLLKPSFSAAALAVLAGIPQRVGFAGESSVLLTRRVRRRRGRHQVETYLDLLRAENLPVDDGHNENWVSSQAVSRVAPIVDRMPAGRTRVFVAMRSTDALKHWDMNRWRRLVHWLVEERGCEIVLSGGPADIAAHQAFRESVGAAAAHVHDLSQAVPLTDMAALAARMQLCIGVDTGLVHLSASVGVPAVVLVGPTDPNRWSPWRIPCAVLRSPRVQCSLAERWLTAMGATDHLRWPLGRAAVDDIPYDDVVAAVSGFLPAPLAVRTIDLTRDGFRYEVVSRPAASVSPAFSTAVD
ncbi:MAG: glycosyltransferase family 9 protein [Planctomycetota bacterium]